MKAWLLVVVEVARWQSFGWFNAAIFRRNFHFWPEPLASPAMYATWDGQHYLYLATHGYHDAGISMVFFPFWPWLIALCSGNLFGAASPTAALIAALVLANALSFAALILLAHLVERLRDAPTADLTLLYMLAFPTAFFLVVPYSEALYLCLSVAFFWVLREKRFAAATTLAVLGALSRPVGVCLAVPLAYVAWQERRAWLPAALLPFAALPLHRVLIRYLATDGAHIEDYQARFVAHASPLAVFDVPRAVFTFFDAAHWHGVTDSILDRAVFVVMIALLVAALRDGRLRALALYGLAYAWIAATAASYVSFARYASMLFPALIVLADWSRDRRWLRALVLLVAFPLELVLFLRHIHNYWAG